MIPDFLTVEWEAKLSALRPSTVEPPPSSDSEDTLSTFKIDRQTFLFGKANSLGWIR